MAHHGSDSNSSIRLTDDEMRRFICDGVLVIHSDQPASLHRTILDKIESIDAQGGQVSSNILPQVSELQKVLDSAPVNGALQSILGPEYMLHPLRMMVPSEPLKLEERGLELEGHENGPPMGDGSRSFSVWHKDTYSPLGRARYHVPRFLYLFYFPHATPVKQGPTRVIPGSQYYDHITEADHPFAYVSDEIQAGSCLLTAFDIEHAGMSNLSDDTRYMVKFSFLRTRNPQAPSWDGGAGEWQQPERFKGRFAHPEAWTHVWNWLRGQRPASKPADRIDEHISHLNGPDQEKRLAAIYSLGGMGEEALEPLLTSLSSVEGHHRIEPPYELNSEGKVVPRGNQTERRWTEGGYIFQDEAYALGCLGHTAVDRLMDLLDSEDPWIRINGAFALGEIGAAASRAVPRLASLLDSTDHRVVRAVLESIACIGENTIAALPAIEILLSMNRDSWAQDLPLEHLVGDQIHLNAVYAMLLSDLDIADVEALLIDLLERPAPNVSVPHMALEILIRRGGERAIKHVLAYLQAHRWDDSPWPAAIGSRRVKSER